MKTRYLTYPPACAIMRECPVREEPIHIDERGTISFIIVEEDGSSYLFEQEQSGRIFVTTKDMYGRATEKRIIDATNQQNKNLLEIFEKYIKEQDIE